MTCCCRSADAHECEKTRHGSTEDGCCCACHDACPSCDGEGGWYGWCDGPNDEWRECDECAGTGTQWEP